MEFQISVLEFTKCLNLMQGIIKRKNTLPILANLLIEAISVNQQHITVRATDLDISLELKQSCNIIKTGKVTAPAKILLDIVKTLPGPNMVLKLQHNSKLQIKSSRTLVFLNSISADEYPKFPMFDNVKFHKLQKIDFASAIQKTLYSVSVDDSRNNLKGVYIKSNKEKINSLSFVSTDGHRLSKIDKVFNKCNFKEFHSVILSRKSLSELLRLLATSSFIKNNLFYLGFVKTQAIAKMDDSTLIMKLIDAKFPDYTQVIPQLSDKILRTSKKDLLTSLKRVSVLTTHKNQSLTLSITSEELFLSCNNPELGVLSDCVSIMYVGEIFKIKLNARYIIEALSSLDEANIMFKFTDSLSPILITGVSNEKHKCIIMPMR
jgi:DNA polymerase-3 subunit beta